MIDKNQEYCCCELDGSEMTMMTMMVMGVEEKEKDHHF